MFIAAKRPWIKRLGLAAVAALAIGTAGLLSAPAQARMFVGVSAPYGWGYYTPAYYYPYYYYPRPVAYRGCGWGGHWVPAHWNRWGHWVPGHCRPNYY
ncbi:MAG: hypothetical protein E6G81_06015 [Alphaproteobacteria bacterium]|nr:MAG: hypothetical protein E6G81_06015 [Alphaproteobacteria bacterium]